MSTPKDKKPWQHDVAVLFLFFTREQQTAAVFEQIKEARPRKLFLYQDGPRPNRPDDVENIEKCRRIVDDIDWDCEVHRKYQERNFGCDPSEFLSQKWMFSHVDKGIVLEDDDVPSQSFFPFCVELLEKYKYDMRINMICGMNNIDVYQDCPYSYFFSKSGSIWGWATWKRNIDLWDSQYKFLEDEYSKKVFIGLKPQDSKRLIETIKRHKSSGREHYESIMGAHRRLQGQLNIVPKYNMITNIGIGLESTHSTNDLGLLPPPIRRLMYKKRFELKFPLKHPLYVMEDKEYERLVKKKTHVPLFQKYFYKLKRFVYKLKQ